MNKYFIMFIALAVSLVSHAQTTYRGKIMDTHKNGLPGATIQSVSDLQNGVVADFNGNFEITLSSGNRVRVSYIGYKTRTITLLANFNKIILEEDKTALNEVVVSASREKQMRSGVPASISTVSLKQIEHSKAFEIWGQVLNIFDTLYAARVTFSPYTQENKYTIGNPRAFHFGIKYSFGK